MSSLIYLENLNPVTEVYTAENIIKFNSYLEDIRKYYGILIPLYVEYLMYGSTHLNTYKIPQNDGVFDDIYSRLHDLIYKNDKTMKEWMEIAVLYSASIDRCHFYKDQITNYNWIDEEYINKMCIRLMNILPKNGTFERYIEHKSIEGIIDYVFQNEIWELKCTSSLTVEHQIQCASYVSLMNIVNEDCYTGRLFNICTGELLLIEVDDPKTFLRILNNK